MANAGTITGHLGLDDSKFKAGVHNAGNWSKQKFAAIGGAAVGAFAAAFTAGKLQELIQAGSEIKTFAMQAGISAEEFQKLNFAIETANGDASDTVSIMLDLKRAMADARTGNKQWIADFESLGITMDQIKKDDPVALFMAIGKAVAKSTELTGEQVNALGRMMGEDTSARAIAAFRNNFEATLESVNVMADSTLTKLREINAELKKAQMANDKQLADAVAGKGDEIKRAIGFWGDVRNTAIKGVLSVGDLLSKSQEGLSIGFGAALYGEDITRLPTQGPMTSSAAVMEQRRHNQIVEKFLQAQLETQKKTEQNTSTNGVSSAIMGG